MPVAVGLQQLDVEALDAAVGAELALERLDHADEVLGSASGCRLDRGVAAAELVGEVVGPELAHDVEAAVGAGDGRHAGRRRRRVRAC